METEDKIKRWQKKARLFGVLEVFSVLLFVVGMVVLAIWRTLNIYDLVSCMSMFMLIFLLEKLRKSSLEMVGIYKELN